jgi:hypothetical protein
MENKQYKQYKKSQAQLMRPYEPGEDMTGVSISHADKLNGSPKLGDMIALNADNHTDKWLVAHDFFIKNYENADTINVEFVSSASNGLSVKSLHNTTANGATKNVKDIKFWGNGDTFRLISKASSENEGWMKSTKAMEIEGVGCVIQVTTQQRNVAGSYSVAEALTFVPNSKIKETFNLEGVVINRQIIII